MLSSYTLVHEDEPQLTPIFKELYMSQIFSEHISGVIASLYKIEDNLLVSKDLANVVEAYVNMLTLPLLYGIGCNEYCSLVVSTEWNRS